MKKKEKNNKFIYRCYLVATICYFISGIIEVFSANKTIGITNIALGSTFLCLAIIYYKKDKDK